MRLTRWVPVACGLLVLAAGCGGSGNAASPTTSDTTSAASSAASSSASTIKNPLDVSQLQSDPCSALTAVQLAPYMGAIRKTDVQRQPNGFGCGWDPVDGNQAAIAVQFFPTYGPDQLDQSGYPWHQPAPDIAGYPAERESGVGDTGPQTGDCTVHAAVSDHATVGILIDAVEPTWRYYTDTYTPAGQLVAQVITNLKSRG